MDNSDISELYLRISKHCKARPIKIIAPSKVITLASGSGKTRTAYAEFLPAKVEQPGEPISLHMTRSKSRKALSLDEDYAGDTASIYFDSDVTEK